MKRQYAAIGLLLASCAMLASLVLTSFVSYAPSVSITLVQNAYIHSILWHTAISGVLQAAAIWLCFRIFTPYEP